MSGRRAQPDPIRIEIDPDSSMPGILAELRRHVDESVVLVVPDDCPVLLTVAEFRALRDTADRAGIDLTIENGTSLRAQLGAMFGFRIVGGQGQSSPSWRPPDTLLGNPRSYTTWTDEDTGGEPRKRKGAPPPPPSYTQRVDDGSLDYLPDDDESRFGANARKAGSIVGIALVAALLIVAGGWYLLPGVTVNAVSRATTVTSEVNYAVAAPGASLPSDIQFTAPAESAEATVPFEISVPTTGIDRTPQDTAHGEVILRNPTGSAIIVPQGSVLTVYAGPTFTTDAEVTIPPAANNIAGEETVTVTATEPGTIGNVEAGMLTGVIPEIGIHYSNRDAAIEGGTDIEVAIVSEDDIQALDDKVINEHARAAAVGWESQLPAGWAVVEPSVVTDPPEYTISSQPGDRAETINVSGTVHATGLIYDSSVVNEEATAFFRESLQEQTPAGYRLDSGSVVLSDPQALAPAPDNVQFRIKASATAYAVVSDADLNTLRSDLAGASWEEAHARLDAAPQFEHYDLRLNPSWWMKRMPRDASRITIDISIPTIVPEVSPAATVEGT